MGNCCSKSSTAEMKKKTKLTEKNINPHHEEIYKKLKHAPLFRKTPSDFLDELASNAQLKKYFDGDCIVKEGTPGTSFYIIATGRVAIKKCTSTNKSVLRNPSDYFTQDQVPSATNTAKPSDTTVTQTTITNKHSLSAQNEKTEKLKLEYIPSEDSKKSRSSLLEPNYSSKGKSSNKAEELNSKPSPNLKEETLAILTTYDYFGETALLTAIPRTASAYSLGASICIEINAEAFEQAKQYLSFPRRNAIFTKRENFHDFEVRPEDYEKTEQDALLIEKALSSNKLFHETESLSKDSNALNRLIAAMFRRNCVKGTRLIQQGEEGNYFYIVAEGSFLVLKDEDIVAGLSSGDSFGELALFNNTPRTASVVCEEDGFVWTLHRMDFRRIIHKLSKERFKNITDHIKKTKLFEKLLEGERTILASVVELEAFPEHTVIIKEGEEGNCMFIITQGTASVTKEDPQEGTRKVNRLGINDYFGELAILGDSKRQATVTAINETLYALKITKSQFDTYCGSLKDLMQRESQEYKEDNRATLFRQKVEIHPYFSSLKLTDFMLIGQLGSGSFGKVKLVELKKERLSAIRDQGEKEFRAERERFNSKEQSSREIVEAMRSRLDLLSGTFALKCMEKVNIASMGQIDHVISERIIMAQVDCPFVIKLFASFKDNIRIYMLMECCLGGELFTLLRKKGAFNEKEARFYLANVIEGFDYLHSRNIVYRDLKPENLMIANDGYLKLADLGFAKFIENKTWTLCGTPDYLSPEIVTGQGHGKPTDIWTLGVLLYEMLCSFPPFYDEDHVKTYTKIIHQSPTFPKNIGADARNLINSLMRKKEYSRLGAQKEGFDAIRKHPFFKGFNWEKLRSKKMKAPFIPKINSNYDLGNFDESFISNEVLEDDSPERENVNTKISEWETYF